MNSNLKNEKALERAWKAVKAFEKQRPSLERLVEALVGRRIPVVAGVGAGESASSTNGEKIFITPPMEMGDELEHTPFLCGKRDRFHELECKACRSHENIMVMIFHELGHNLFSTFANLGGFRNESGLYSKFIKMDLGDALPKDIKKLDPAHSMFDLAMRHSSYGHMILNVLEDVRIDSRMFKERPGYEEMMRNQTFSLFARGNEDASGERSSWKEQSLNAQAIISLLLIGHHDEDLLTFLDEQVSVIWNDDIIKSLMMRVSRANSVYENIILMVEITSRFRELGFLEDLKKPEPEPEDEPEDKPEDKPQGEFSKENTEENKEKNEQEPGDSGDQGDSGDSKESREAEDSAESSESAKSDESTEPGGEEGKGSPDGGTPQGSGSLEEAVGNDESGQVASSGISDSSSSGEEDGPQGNLESEESGESIPADTPSRNGGGQSESESEDGSACGSGSDIGSGLGGGHKEGGRSHATGGGSSGRADQESLEEPYLGDGFNTGPDRVPGPVLGTVDAGTPPHTSDAGHAGDPPGPDASATANDSSLYETDPEVISKMIEEFINHCGVKGKHDLLLAFSSNDEENLQKAEFDDSEEYEALVVAIVQSLHFDSPSLGLFGLSVIEPDNHASYEESLQENNYDYNLDYDVKPKNLKINEGLLGGALLKLRLAFEENARSKHTRHLKSGKVNTRSLGKRAPLGDDRLFMRKTLPNKRDYAVLIAMDCSGSIGYGNRFLEEKRAVAAQAELLSRLGIKFAILGHTGKVARDEIEMNVVIFKVKDYNELWSAKHLQRLASIPAGGGNVDGHTLEFLRKNVMAQKATDRVIMYYSDGAMPQYNYDEEKRILQREIEFCKSNNITLFGVGIETNSPSRHGLPTVRVDTDSDLIKVVEHTRKALA